MNKAALGRKLSKLPGFKKKGAFYIGTCNDDLIAGYAIDAPSNNIYVWQFIVPTYDNVEFLHMALGKRILTIPSIDVDAEKNASSQNNIETAIADDWSILSSIKSRDNLLIHLDQGRFDNGYARWTRYITYIRNGDIGKAESMYKDLKEDPAFPDTGLVANSWNLVSKAKAEHGWEGVQGLLDTWSERTLATFC